MTPIHPPSGACGPPGAWPRRVSASVARRGDARGGKGRREAGPRRPFGAVRLNLRLPRPPSPTRGRGAGEEGSPRQVRSAGASGGTVRPRRGPLPRSRRESKGNGGVRGCDRHGVPWTPTGSAGIPWCPRADPGVHPFREFRKEAFIDHTRPGTASGKGRFRLVGASGERRRPFGAGARVPGRGQGWDRSDRRDGRLPHHGLGGAPFGAGPSAFGAGGPASGGVVARPGNAGGGARGGK